jgi:hypothetical protein
MAAGLGFKDFTTGEVLTAADVDGYLMQGVWVFASAAARDAAVTSPEEGNFAYLKDTNVTTYYTGSAWANLDTTGMTNPMTTTGDTIYSSSGSTPARLGIGSSGQVLTVASGVPSWATPASGGMTLLSTTSLTGATTTISSISSSYVNLFLVISGVSNATADGDKIRVAVNGNTNTAYGQSGVFTLPSTLATGGLNGDYIRTTGVNFARADTTNIFILQLYNYASATTYKQWKFDWGIQSTSTYYSGNASGFINSTTAISSLVFSASGGNLSTGTVLLYGVK